jgi:phosphoglycerate kinase
MQLPRLEDLPVSGKKVLMRADLDTEYRLQALIPTLDYLFKNKAEIILLGHKGRPGGKVAKDLSLKPLEARFRKWQVRVEENLRFDPGEEANDESFARQLAKKGDVYVNEAFGASHREHASIVTLPKLLPHAAGFRFQKEVENLSRVFENSKRPVLVIVGGLKKDKLDYIKDFKKFADKILIAGRLPEYLQKVSDEKLLIANLLPDKEDITVRSIEKFEEEIAKAGTLVVSGPMGKFEEEDHKQGTERVFKAVADPSAFKIAGGGETQKAISMFGLEDKFNWISVGGGAMLEFLAKRTLPGIQALLH